MRRKRASKQCHVLLQIEIKWKQVYSGDGAMRGSLQEAANPDQTQQEMFVKQAVRNRLQAAE